MRKLKQLVSKGKKSDDSSSRSSSKSEDTQNSSGSSARKQDPELQANAGSSAQKKGDSSQTSRRPSISEEREPNRASNDSLAMRQEIEFQPQGVWPAPGIPYRNVGGGYLAPTRTRSLSKAVHNRASKVESLSTIDSEDSTSTDNDAAQHERYAFLKSLETVFVVDDSASMANRWEEISSALQILVPICAQYVKGGIEVAFINRKGRFTNAKSAKDVVRMFEDTNATGTTPTGEVLCMVFRKYLQRFERWSQKWGDEFFPPLNVVVITSGVPTDTSTYFQLRSVIERNTSKLQQMNASEAQLSVHFFQVGQDSAAADFLEKLDDDCKNGKFARDIVDTNSYRRYDGILSPETVFGAIESRLTRTRKGKGKA